MDFATILGLTSGFALLGLAILIGGAPGAFFDAPSLLIVFGGTFAVTAMSFSIKEIMRVPKVALQALFQSANDPSTAASQMIELAELARDQGPLALQNIQPRLVHLPFLSHGVAMVIDGSKSDEIERVMNRKVSAMSNRHDKATGVLRKAAEVSPAMGLIGTLVGLVQMLGQLDDPTTIGPSMAVALLTTFYGAVLSNMVFSPLASKLERNSDEEMLLNNIYVTGVTSIGRQENPRRLEMLVNTLLSPTDRVQHFD
jgi:chemotaxis protein MotA